MRRLGSALLLLVACRVGPAQPDSRATDPLGAVAASPTDVSPPAHAAEPGDPVELSAPPEPPGPLAVSAAEPRVTLEPDARWSVLSTPIASTHDGRGWIGTVDDALVVYRGRRQVQRFPVVAFGSDQLAALPNGRWIVGARLLEADGRIRFDGHSWCNHLGRFASCRASEFSRDGTTAILAASDSPSTCLRDRACGNAGSWRGVLARVNFDLESAAPTMRVLIEHEERRDFVVAASERWVAAAEGPVLSIWPAVGDGEPTLVSLDSGGPSRLVWLGDDLVVTRWVDTEYTEVVVLDGARGYAPAARWIVEGSLQSIAARPGGGWIAIGTSWYRARAKVEIDLKRIELYAPDGVRHVQIELDGLPTSMSWSPQGDALFVAVWVDRTRHRVVRYSVKD